MNQRREFMKWLSATLLTLLMFALAGCGGDGSTPPAKVAGVAAAAGDGQATVTWTASNDAASYNVYYAATSGVTTVNGTKVAGAASGQAITGLANGTTYHVVVTTVSAAGEGVVSDEVSVTPLPPLPAKVPGITPTGDDGQVLITWGSVSGATSYNVYWSTTAGTAATSGAKVANATSGQVITGLTNGQTYYFVVKAENMAGEGPASTEKSATPAPALQAPTSPSGVTVTAGAGQVTVAWGTVSLTDSYNVYYLQSATAPTTATVIATGTKLSSTSSPLVVTGLTAGASYWFTVTAVNAAGESGGQSNPKKAIPL